MISIERGSTSIIVKATEGEYIYPSAKTELELPLNSVILTLDDSEMAVFRSASNFDVLFTALIDNLTIDGASVTKDNIADKFADAATSDQGGFKYEVVDELPSEGEKGTIYLVPNEEGTHTEYLYVENVGWEQVGTAEVDLSDYYTKDEVDEGNRVNAAAFNVLQKSIGLNENLETIDGKSIQAQIDELKEGSDNKYDKVEGIDITTNDGGVFDLESQITIASYTNEDGYWNPTVELRCDTNNDSYIGMYGGAGDPFFDVARTEENGDYKETWFDYERIGWYEIIDGVGREGIIYYKDIKPIVTLTQSEYDALEEKDPNTVYLIKG